MDTRQTIELHIDIDEVNLILEALGQLPFVRVYTLIGRIQEQARAQMAGPSAPAPQAAPVASIKDPEGAHG